MTSAAVLNQAADAFEERAKGQQELFNYRPHPGQLAFHKSTALIRAIFCANRWGKTVAGTKEFDWWATGKHPHRETPPVPTRQRLVADGFNDGIDKIVMPLFRDPMTIRNADGNFQKLQLVDPRDLLGGSWNQAYNGSKRTLTYANRSVIDFMSYSQKDLGRGVQKFGGVALDQVWNDEHGEHTIWEECTARIGGRPVYMMVTLTPIQGKTWEYDEIYERWEAGESGINCFGGLIQDNPHLDPGAVADFLSRIKDANRRAIRGRGAWIDLGGSVYGIWVLDIHFIPYDQERVDKATKSIIIDTHPSKPEAVVWCGISADNCKFAYREILADKPIAEVAQDIMRLSADEDIRHFLIDPHWGWTDKDTGKSKIDRYREAGIPVQPAYNGPDNNLYERMRTELDFSPTMRRAGFAVMDTCPKLRWQFEHNKFKEQTDAMSESDRWVRIKRDDDLLICAEYYTMSNPTYRGSRASAHHKPHPGSTAHRILSRSKGKWGKVPTKRP